MQLIKCKIENFGKLNNVSLNFEKGLNCFVEENGWGKSTLAAFIKVMFFGFDGERTLDALKNERKRYTPWQGGVYGGSLTFETAGKMYTITRIFGAKEKDDTFELRDADTNLPSADFTENVGAQLFQIDGTSFARTVYISQNDCATETTDSINAKLGNLADHTDDINNFENVIGRFQDMLNKMSPRRKTGTLAIRKNQIAELSQEIKKGDAIDRAIAELTANSKAKKAEYAALKNRQQELEKKQEVVQQKKDLQTKQEKYQMLCENLAERQAEYEQEQAYFPGELPTTEDLMTYGQISQSMLQLQQSMDHYQLSPEEEQGLERLIPTEAEIDKCWDIYPQIQELDKQIVAQGAALQAAKATATAKKGPKWIWFVLGLVLAAVGVALILKEVFFGGLPLALVGLLSIILGLMGGQKKEIASPFAEQEQKLQNLQEEREGLYQVMYSILKLYVKKEELQESRMLITLQELRRAAQKGKALKEKENQYKKAERDYEESKQKIVSYLNALSISMSHDLVGQFVALREHLKSYERVQKLYAESKTAKENFEAVNDISRFTGDEAVSSGESLADIGEELRHISQQLENIHQDILSYERQLETQRELRDSISEKETELEQLQELQMQEQKKQELIAKTKELMEQAKVSFTKKYMAPIMNGFEKYYGILTGETAENYQLDANTKLTVQECGVQHDTKFFSTGYQDLMGVCMRLALIDAMYQGEKPFVIMDDPFVNLDEEKTKGGLALLAEVAKEYQVVYFSCHGSREYGKI